MIAKSFVFTLNIFPSHADDAGKSLHNWIFKSQNEQTRSYSTRSYLDILVTFTYWNTWKLHWEHSKSSRRRFPRSSNRNKFGMSTSTQSCLSIQESCVLVIQRKILCEFNRKMAQFHGKNTHLDHSYFFNFKNHQTKTVHWKITTICRRCNFNRIQLIENRAANGL